MFIAQQACSDCCTESGWLYVFIISHSNLPNGHIMFVCVYKPMYI